MSLLCLLVSVAAIIGERGKVRSIWGKRYRDLNDPLGWRFSSFRNILLYTQTNQFLFGYRDCIEPRRREIPASLL